MTTIDDTLELCDIPGCGAAVELVTVGTQAAERDLTQTAEARVPRHEYRCAKGHRQTNRL